MLRAFAALAALAVSGCLTPSASHAGGHLRIDVENSAHGDLTFALQATVFPARNVSAPHSGTAPNVRLAWEGDVTVDDVGLDIVERSSGAKLVSSFPMRGATFVTVESYADGSLGLFVADHEPLYD